MTALAVDVGVRGAATAMVVRRARVADAPAIAGLICSWSDQGLTIRRSVGDVLGVIGSFVVVEAGGVMGKAMGGAVIACACVEACGRGVGEVRSVAVAEQARGMGAGRAVLAGAVKAADEGGIRELFLLTKIPEWFVRGGFVEVAIADLPGWWVRERVLDVGRELAGRSAMRRRVP